MDQVRLSEGPIWGSGYRAQNGPIFFLKKGLKICTHDRAIWGAPAAERFAATIALPLVPTGSIWT